MRTPGCPGESGELLGGSLGSPVLSGCLWTWGQWVGMPLAQTWKSGSTWLVFAVEKRGSESKQEAAIAQRALKQGTAAFAK